MPHNILAEVSKNLATYLKVILLNYLNNYEVISNMMRNAAKF